MSLELFKAIVSGGIAAGALDIAYALIAAGLRGVAPTRVLQAIASGLLGRAAYSGGTATAALGLSLHFFIAFTAAAVYALASLRLPGLIARPVLCGALYGTAVHLVMRFIVLPLSAFNVGAFSVRGLIVSILVHIFCVGLPIAFCTRWALLRTTVTATL